MPMNATYTTLNGQIVYENRGGVRRYYGAGVCGAIASIVDPPVPPVELYDCRPKTRDPMWPILDSFAHFRTWLPKNELGELN